MEAYIIKGYRTAVGKAKKGGFRNYRSDDLAVHVIKHLMKNIPEINSNQVDDVIVGCANPEGEQGLQIGRLISARALGNQVAGITINRYCASGLEAIAQFQDLIGDEPLKPEIDEDADVQSTNLENLDLSDEQKKYVDFNNKRIKELETHFTHLKIETNENELTQEKMDTQDKRNDSE